MEDDEGYMALEPRSKRGAAGSPPALRGAAAPGCPRWHRVALGAGWSGNLLLGVAVVALGCSFLQRQNAGSDRNGNGNVGDTNGTLENFISALRKFLCPSQPHGAEGCRICPQGWTLGRTKCYWISTGYSPWRRSLENCRGQGATLLLPQDWDELEFLNETLQKSGRNFWMGLWVPEAGTGWTWLNGSRLDLDQFQVHLGEQPGDCGTVRGSRIIAQDCGLELQWICQREASTL